jgi:two-component system response regulator HupR/HoxA
MVRSEATPCFSTRSAICRSTYSPTFFASYGRASLHGSATPGPSRWMSGSIAATNRDLESEVKAGRFRSDLFFRLSAITLRLPLLRDRPHSTRLLAEHFIRTAAARFGRPTPRLAEDCLSALTAYGFPGNVRELESEMARLAALASADVPCGADLLNERIRNGGKSLSGASSQATPIAPMSLHEMEKQLIFSVLQHTGGNRTRAAEILGISRAGLRTKLQRLQIPSVPDPLS